jgi:hypothetical protein
MYDASNHEEIRLAERLVDSDDVQVLSDTEKFIPDDCELACPAVLVSCGGAWKCFIRDKNYFAIFGNFN